MTDQDEDRVRAIASEAANSQILQHLSLCPFKIDDVNARLRGVEISLARLIGFMLGSGLIGGFTGGAISHLIK